MKNDRSHPNNPREQFLKRLALRMRQVGLNQAQLAKAIDRQQSTVSDYFNAVIRSLPDGQAMLLMPKALRCSGHWLLTGEPPVHPPSVKPSDDTVRSEGALEVVQEIRRTLDEAEKGWLRDGQRRK